MIAMAFAVTLAGGVLWLAWKSGKYDLFAYMESKRGSSEMARRFENKSAGYFIAAGLVLLAALAVARWG
jgi:uncharacterized membrane protein